MFALEIFGAWLLADFWSGLAHWWLDHYSKDSSSIGYDNTVHHAYPWKITKISKFDNLSTSFPYVIGLAALMFLVGISHFLVLSVAFLSIGNLVHRWSHDPHRSNAVRFLQWTGIFQSYAHHYVHHYPEIREPVLRREARCRFCVMTNFLNPILDRAGFFGGLDRIAGRWL